MGLHFIENEACQCGKIHKTTVEHCVIEAGAIRRIPGYARHFGATKAFLVADHNTYPLVGEKIENLLAESGIPTAKYIYKEKQLEPDEGAVGSLMMCFDATCDLIVAVGSGVINDICKILSCVTGRKYIIVGTAPSMDGYASATSSMVMGGLKVSLNSRCADVIIGDIDILKQAPEHMLKSGLGDMLAKYVSIAEWRIANIITGEYYCEALAQLVRRALKKCVDNAEGLLKRDEAAVEAVFEGLVIGGVAMTYAGVSRPASGVEHYFSHVCDMRGLEFDLPVDSHGVQCACGTLYAIKCYQLLKHIVPDPQKALDYVRNFNADDWNCQLRTFIGRGAEHMIALEGKEQKYSVEKHARRLDVILGNWERILGVIDEELPSVEAFEELLQTIGLPTSIEQIGIERDKLPMTLKCTKDMRDKYVLTRLLWDLGILDEFCNRVF